MLSTLSMILVLYQCQSFSTATGVTYTAQDADMKVARAWADYLCSSHENPGDPEHPNPNSCVDLGCKQIKGAAQADEADVGTDASGLTEDQR